MHQCCIITLVKSSENPQLVAGKGKANVCSGAYKKKKKKESGASNLSSHKEVREEIQEVPEPENTLAVLLAATKKGQKSQVSLGGGQRSSPASSWPKPWRKGRGEVHEALMTSAKVL